MRSKGHKISFSNGNLKITHKDSGTEIIVDANGKLKLKNKSFEVISLISDLITTLQSAKTVTSIGPQPFMGDTIAKLIVVGNKLKTFI